MYVGHKLEAAIEQLGIDVAGKVALDSGLSTGGFTDCLLQYGASFVYGVDVGYGQVMPGVVNVLKPEAIIAITEHTFTEIFNRWVSKDGIGAVGRLFIGGRFGNLFDDDPK